MKSFLKCVGAMAAIVLLSGAALAADDQVFAGKIKSSDAVKKQFVLTDAAGKDSTFKFSDNMIIDRDGKASQGELKAGEKVNVCYHKGTLTWTAHYILVQENDNQNSYLVRCTIKSYDADKKVLVYTDADGKDCSFPLGDSKVRLNGQASKIEDIKIGDKALAIIEKVGDKTTLKTVMAERGS